MADSETVTLNEPHKPHANAIAAFKEVEAKIKHEILASRKRWDHHEPRMWSRAAGISDHDLVDFKIDSDDSDLVQVRSGPTAYGTIILGKIKLGKKVKDDLGQGYVHVRIHDPPERGTDDVKFHSIFTDEGKRDEDGHAERYQAIQTLETPLEFFNE